MIYYSHINEDNRVERSLLQAGGCATVVAVCGSGERVLALLDVETCTRVVVVDNNEEAIFLLQLKLAALRHLSVDDYLAFIGHQAMPKEERWQLFEELEQTLPTAASAFWWQRKPAIKNGVLHAGHFETFLRRLRPLTNFYLGDGFQTIFQPQAARSSFPHRRWRLLKRVFSSKTIYRLAGNRDAAFVGRGAETAAIPEALDASFKKGSAGESFVTHLIFKGHLRGMAENNLPPSLRRSTLAATKHRLATGDVRIECCVNDLLDFAQQHAASLRPPVFYSLSDILSFVDFGYLQGVMKCIATTGNTVVGRSFLRNRLTPSQLDALRQYGELHLHDDKEATGMYQVFSVNATKP